MILRINVIILIDTYTLNYIFIGYHYKLMFPLSKLNQIDQQKC